MALLAGGLGVSAALVHGREATQHLVPLAGPTQLRHGELVTDALPVATPIRVVVALRMRNRDALEQFVENRYVAGAEPLTGERFLADHAPTPEQVQRVTAFLSAKGFSNIEVAPNRLLVTADGRADIAESAFNTTLSRAKAIDGREAFVNTDSVSVPQELQDSVLAVLGLQTLHQAHTMMHQSTVLAAPAGHSPLEFPGIYGGADALPASDITIGIIAQGKMSGVISDLTAFTSRNGLPAVSIQIVNTGTPSNDTASIGEWDLDSQSIVGMAGRVKKLVFYVSPTLSNADLTASYNAAVNDTTNLPRVINVSLGDCEALLQADGSAQADDQIFLQAVAQNRTFVVASGDWGANGNCTVDDPGAPPNTQDWPASSRYVVAVGGTQLHTSVDGAWSGESVWNDLATAQHGTGGGPSIFEPMPSWQQGVGQNAGHSTRGVPDVAFDGAPSSGAQVIINGATQVWGGTSLSSPLFVGVWARVLEAKGANLGFAAPLIYRLPARDFHDVVSGNNGTFSAAPGWDYASGFGSMIIDNVIADVPVGGGTPVANFSFAVQGLTVIFTDTSTDSGGTIGTHSWNFGDGSIMSTLAHPTHVYTAAGIYTVTETVSDSATGTISSKAQSVSVVAPSLTVTPNPVVIAPNAASASMTIRWNAPGYSQVTLYGVQNIQNPGRIQCLGSGAGSGTTGSGMTVGEVATLWLLPYTACTPGSFVTSLPQAALAKVDVRSVTMAATPNPVTVPATEKSANATLTWNAAGYSQVTLYGRQNIDNPGLIQCLGSGAATGSTTINMKRGEVATLWLSSTSCTPGAFVSSVQGVLVTLDVSAN